MNCYYHEQKDGQYQCEVCGKNICKECTHFEDSKALCKDCYVELGSNNINHNYNKFWGGILSIIPGAGQMYLGFMQQGLVIMLAFFGIICLTGNGISTPIFPFMIAVMWFYSFFDAYHLRNKINNNEVINQKPLFKIKSSYFAYGFIIIGSIMLINQYVSDILTFSQLRVVRSIIAPVLLIVVGVIILLRIKKEEKRIN